MMNKILILGISLIWTLTTAVMAAPWRPSQAHQVILTLPANWQPTALDHPVSLSVDEVVLRVQSRLDQAYQQGDPRLIGQAKALLARYQQLQDPRLLMLNAQAAQADHQFEQAKQLLEKLVRQDPYHDQAWLNLAAIAVVQGQIQPADNSCQQLKNLSVLPLRMLCIAQVDAIAGKAAAAKQKINQLYALKSTLTADQQLWFNLIAADLAIRTQDQVLAERTFADIGSSIPAQVAHSDWLLNQGKAQAVIRQLPQNPLQDALLIRLTRAHLLLQTPQAANYVKRIQQRFIQQQTRPELGHWREMAQMALLLRRPKQALIFSRTNWQHQRETADLVVYATAAMRMRSIEDLNELHTWMQRTGFEYPQVSKKIKLTLQSAS